MQRRHLIQGLIGGGLGSTLAGSLSGCASAGPAAGRAQAHVVVVGGGYGGATAAKYLRLFSGQRLDVTLIEAEPDFVSCPMSNLVIGGQRQLGDLTRSYAGLASRHGVHVLHQRVSAIDASKKRLALANGESIGYDRLVLSPGVEMIWDSVQDLQAAQAEGRILQAWKAGPETVALRRQLEAMPDGGIFAIAIPEVPYRCPPGPYERACLVAAYFKRQKPRAKVLILDANPDVTSKPGLFKKAWSELYPGMIEYRPEHKALAVDARSNTVKFEVQDDVRADVLNVLPAMRAGALAVQAGLANANGRWCHVNFLNFESTAAPGIHVLGDSIQVAAAMPKSGHMANSHGKVAAAAIAAELLGQPVNPQPMLSNTCYSYVADAQAVHVASVHEYLADQKTFRAVAGSGGVSDARSELEARHAQAWARNIWADMLD